MSSVKDVYDGWVALGIRESYKSMLGLEVS